MAAGEKPGELARIDLVAGDIPFRQVEHLGHTGQFLIRHLEHPFECRHLISGDDAIGLGHLGAERDDTDGEGNRFLGRRCAPILRKESRD